MTLSQHMQTDTDRLQHFVALMSAGQVDEARLMVSPDVVIHEPAGIPYAGVHTGLSGFDDFRRLFSETWRRWSDGPMWFAEHDGTVVKRNEITAVSRATGRDFTTPLAEFFTFTDGKISRIEIYYQDIVGFRAAIES